jgi:hypothetical protein
MGNDCSANGVESSILVIRGHKVMLDVRLAEFYKVGTDKLIKAVKANSSRLPADFMFQLTADECRVLEEHDDVRKRLKCSKNLPFVFTEQGVAMLSSILAGNHAIQMNVAIMRAFVRLRETLAAQRDLAARLKDLHNKIGGLDENIRNMFETLQDFQTGSTPHQGHVCNIVKSGKRR